MKRIDIVYGGQIYSVGGRDLGDLEREIARGLADGGRWLEVNDGEGMRRDALLYLSPGVSIALVPIPEGVDDLGEDSAASAA